PMTKASATSATNVARTDRFLQIPPPRTFRRVPTGNESSHLGWSAVKGDLISFAQLSADRERRATGSHQERHTEDARDELRREFRPEIDRKHIEEAEKHGRHRSRDGEDQGE